jgi:HEAT repeat protein
MRLRSFQPLIAMLVAPMTWATTAAEPAGNAEVREAEQLLHKAGVATDGPGLLEFFRKQTARGPSPERVAALVKQLGDRAFRARESASKELTALGLPVLPDLRQALRSPDAEVQRRARQCIEVIEQKSTVPLAAAAARLLKLRRPPDAVPVLLRYLPLADETAEDEILEALAVLGVREGRADAALDAALHDKVPVRQAAAARVLGGAGSATQKAAVRELLHKADAKVRLRAAQGLLAGCDKSAVPALVALLDQGPVEVAYQAEDLLGGLAGVRAPAVGLEDTTVARRKCRAAWEAWWRRNASKLHLTDADVAALFNTSVRTREVARRFLGALLKGDGATLRRTTDVPFGIVAGDQAMTFRTRADFDNFIKDFARQAKDQRMTFTVRKVVGLNEYARSAGKGQAAFLKTLRPAEVRAVYAEVTQNGRADGGVILVRLVRGRALVIGIGDDSSQRKKL